MGTSPEVCLSVYKNRFRPALTPIFQFCSPLTETTRTHSRDEWQKGFLSSSQMTHGYFNGASRGTAGGEILGRLARAVFQSEKGWRYRFASPPSALDDSLYCICLNQDASQSKTVPTGSRSTDAWAKGAFEKISPHLPVLEGSVWWSRGGGRATWEP